MVAEKPVKDKAGSGSKPGLEFCGRTILEKTKIPVPYLEVQGSYTGSLYGIRICILWYRVFGI